MVRKKIQMKLIADEKSRHITYKRRIIGMKKKAAELHTLCDIDVLFVCFPQDAAASVAWPDNPFEFRRIVQRYQYLNPLARKQYMQDMPIFFEKMSASMEKQLCLRPNAANVVGQQPLKSLRKLVSDLDVNIGMMTERIESLKGNSEAPSKGKELLKGSSELPSKGKELVVDEHQQPIMACHPSFSFDMMMNGAYTIGSNPSRASCLDGATTEVGDGHINTEMITKRTDSVKAISGASSIGKELVVVREAQQPVMACHPSFGFDMMMNGAYAAGGHPYLAARLDGTTTNVGDGPLNLCFPPMMGAFWMNDGGTSAKYSYGMPSMPLAMGPIGAPVLIPDNNRWGRVQLAWQGPFLQNSEKTL